ncbi:MAG: DUF1611 domain-containing protein [Pseudomonadota bacterium]
MQTIEKPYLLYLGDADAGYGAKTAEGLVHWCPDDCLAQSRMPSCEVDLGIPDLSFSEAVAQGARTLVLGVAARGGILPEHWIDHLVEALEAGLNIASGLHDRLTDVPALREAAQKHGRTLHDVRQPPKKLPLATGIKRSGKRILMVGTDCAVGKKFSALSIHRGLQHAGAKATFRPTGQTGVLIAGHGIALDAVPGDFISGVAEALSPDADEDHFDIIEGQATVLHPTFAAVTLGLVHGSQPDALVLCHQAEQSMVRGLHPRPLPSMRDSIDAHLAAARVTNPAVKAIGLSINTRRLSTDDEARNYLRRTEQNLGLPACDSVRFGVTPLVEAVLKL